MKSTIDMIEVMQHFANGGEVEFKFHISSGDSWKPTPKTPSWNWADINYRKKEPARRKIKMLCWFDNEQIFWLAEGTEPKWPSTRVPSEDKEIEV